VAERSKAWVCGRSLAGVMGSNSARGMDVTVVCCQVEDSREGLITLPEESWRACCAWVWSRNLHIEEALAK